MTTLDSYVTLGQSGLRVSPLTLGAMTFGEDWGWGTDPDTSHQLLDAYVEAGGNAIDTANLYTNGHSEKIIGDWLTAAPGRRDRLVLGTKFFANLHVGDPNGGGASRKAVIDQLDQSLRRLRTDYVDLLWLHNWDRYTPLPETLRVLDDLVRAGKVRYLGFSDVPAWVASEAQTLARLSGWSPITAFQLEYSLLERTVEGEHLDMCDAHGIGVMPWSPLKNGRLSGKYRRGDQSPADAKRQAFAANIPECDWPIIDELIAIATELDASPAATAIAWVQYQAGVDSTLIGARTVEQLHANLAGLEIVFEPAQLHRLDAISTPRLAFPAMYAGSRGTLQYAGATVDGRAHAVNPPLTESAVRY